MEDIDIDIPSVHLSAWDTSE